MMLPPIGRGQSPAIGPGQPQRQRADSLEQFFAERRQSHPALEPRPPHERRNCGTLRRERQCRNEAGDTDPQTNALLNPLPALKECVHDPELHAQLLILKMKQCQQELDWVEPEASAAEKEVKAEALRELVEWLCSRRSQGQLNESRQMQLELLEVVRMNLFRVLPPPSESAQLEADPEEMAGIGLGTKLLSSGACLEPGWAHLQLVYRLLQQIIQWLEPNREGGMAELVDGHFVGQLLALFHSEDPREREQAKQTLHSLYSRMVPLRAEIRKQISWLLLAHVHEGHPCRGIPELLNILGEIVNGFNVPLKSEHRQYFLRVLLPLHKPHGYLAYFAPLAYCVALFLEKDPTLAKPTFDALLHHWPRHSSAKEILFMAELEELLSRVETRQFSSICVPLFQQLAKCVSSQHCRVAERALQLWNNENVLALVESNCQLALPIMFPALYTASQDHWSGPITTMVFKTLKRLMCLNAVLFDELIQDWEKEQMNRRKRHNEREELWRKLSDALLSQKKAKEGDEEEEKKPIGERKGEEEEKENSYKSMAMGMEEVQQQEKRSGARRRISRSSSRRGSAESDGDGAGRGPMRKGHKNNGNRRSQKAQRPEHSCPLIKHQFALI